MHGGGPAVTSGKPLDLAYVQVRQNFFEGGLALMRPTFPLANTTYFYGGTRSQVENEHYFIYKLTVH
jgi:hypothetical protein